MHLQKWYLALYRDTLGMYWSQHGLILGHSLPGLVYTRGDSLRPNAHQTSLSVYARADSQKRYLVLDRGTLCIYRSQRDLISGLKPWARVHVSKLEVRPSEEDHILYLCFDGEEHVVQFKSVCCLEIHAHTLLVLLLCRLCPVPPLVRVYGERGPHPAPVLDWEEHVVQFKSVCRTHSGPSPSVICALLPLG